MGSNQRLHLMPWVGAIERWCVPKRCLDLTGAGEARVVRRTALVPGVCTRRFLWACSQAAWPKEQRELHMPIYEYRCHNCRRRVSIWWRTFSEAETGAAHCPRCDSEELTRLVSKVRVVRSEESRLEDLSDPTSFGDLDENDPRSIARFMRKMGDETGEDLGPEF